MAEDNRDANMSDHTAFDQAVEVPDQTVDDIDNLIMEADPSDMDTDMDATAMFQSLLDAEMQVARAADTEGLLAFFGENNITGLRNLQTTRQIEVGEYSAMQPGPWPLALGGQAYTLTEKTTGYGRRSVFPLHGLMQVRGESKPLFDKSLVNFPPTDAQLSRLARYVQIAIETTVPFIFRDEAGFTVVDYDAVIDLDEAEYERLGNIERLSTGDGRHRMVEEVMMTHDAELVVFLCPEVSLASIVDYLPRFVGRLRVHYTTDQPDEPAAPAPAPPATPRHPNPRQYVPPPSLLVQHRTGARIVMQPAPPEETGDSLWSPCKLQTVFVSRTAARDVGGPVPPPAQRIRIQALDEPARMGGRVVFCDQEGQRREGLLLAKSVKLPTDEEQGGRAVVTPPRDRGMYQFAHLELTQKLPVVNWVYMGQQEGNPAPLPRALAAHGELAYEDGDGSANNNSNSNSNNNNGSADQPQSRKFVGWFQDYLDTGAWSGFCRVVSSSTLSVRSLTLLKVFDGRVNGHERPRAAWWPQERAMRALLDDPRGRHANVDVGALVREMDSMGINNMELD